MFKKASVVIALTMMLTLCVTGCKGREQQGLGGGAKLLESMITDYGDRSQTVRFEYDAQNRIVKTYHYRNEILGHTKTITYGGGGSITLVIDYPENPTNNITSNFVENGNTITATHITSHETYSNTFTVNNDGYLVRVNLQADPEADMPNTGTYQYQDGNLTEAKVFFEENGVVGGTSSLMEFQYDDTKSPFYNDQTPKWLLIYSYFQTCFRYIGLKNNITTKNHSYHWLHFQSTSTNVYEFDGDGFPIRQTTTSIDERSGESTTITTLTTFTYHGETENRTAETETGGDDIVHDPDFDMYGTWVYVVTPSSFEDWGWSPPRITISTDNTVTVLMMESHHTGVMSRASTHFRVGSLSGWSDGEEWTTDEEWPFTYNPETELLAFVFGDRIGLRYFRRATADDLAPSAETKQEHTTFTDLRDNQTYRTVRIGSLIWMAQNLNHVTNDSWCYDDNASNCEKYGRLYTWDAAMTACPAGWRLPTREDWNNLVGAAGGGVAGTKLKSRSPDWNGTDDFSFSVLPGGMRGRTGAFTNIGEFGYIWSATESDSESAFYRYMVTDSDNVIELQGRKTSLLSVRCVQ
ncbi:MAG: hypothetical protein LBU70_09760 [Chitinispirillales bacterium]|jgi:uncharacterized protein (TIGR02145 family)|nr:hypothetical protein [Chitinispirillales bacterium]